MRELAVLTDSGGNAIYWHSPPNAVSSYIPDSSQFWDVLWKNRDRVASVTHLHPWTGEARASAVDLETMRSVERGLGRPLGWYVASFDNISAYGTAASSFLSTSVVEALRYCGRYQRRVPRCVRQPLPVPYAVEIVADSVNSHGNRLTTWALTYPRFVHAELMTHRMFARNAASSRAIPNTKLRAIVEKTPALPIYWGANQSGMQARAELTGPARNEAELLWLTARNLMLNYSARLADAGLHKQLCNRIIEPWMPITVLVSATNFANFFHQRDHKDAQPELQIIATEMFYQYLESVPARLSANDWHMPYITLEDRDDVADLIDAQEAPATLDQRSGHIQEALRKISVGRCARVSYLNHEGVRSVVDDVELYQKLVGSVDDAKPGHFSPLEHVARPASGRFGPYIGWKSLRATYKGEAGPGPEHDLYYGDGSA